MLGLFEWNKKSKDSSKLNLPTNLGAFPSQSQLQPNIPSDIPMQLPKFPDFPNEQNKELNVPSFGQEPIQNQSPNADLRPRSQNISQNMSFDSRDLPLKNQNGDFSQNNHYNQNDNYNQNNNYYDENNDFSKEMIKEPRKEPMSESNKHVEDSIAAIKNIADSMKKDPNNPFEYEKYEKALNSTPRNSDSNEDDTDYSELEGEENHLKFREDLVLNSPLFVNVFDFATILEDVAEIKTGVTNTNNAYIRVSNIIKDKEVQFSNYDKLLEDIQKKLVYVDKILFES